MVTLLLATLILQKDDYTSIRRASESYGRATSVSGTLECDSFGTKEIWTFSIAPKKVSFLKTPNRLYLAEVGRYLVYQPFDKTYFVSRLPNTIMHIEDLWLFDRIGEGAGVPPPYLQTQTQPKKVKFGGRAAWSIGGLHRADAKVEAFLDAKTGELLGWNECWGRSEPNRRFRLKSLAWNKATSAPGFSLPKGARPVSLDALMYLPNGQPMPDLGLVDERGGKASLAKLLSGQGGAVVSIGTTGCGPCEASKRFAARNRAAFAAKKVNFVALEAGSSQADMEKIAKENPVGFRIYRQSGPEDLRFRLKLAGMPTIYFLDSHRRVIYAQQGFEAKEFIKSLAKLGLTGLKP